MNNITLAQYMIDEEGHTVSIKCIMDGVTMYIPINPNNTDYQMIMEWVAEGNTITDNGGGE